MKVQKVSIQLNQKLICGGVALIEHDGRSVPVFFDVVKSDPIRIIVGGRGKEIPIQDADLYENALMEIFKKHNIPLKLGCYRVSA